MMCLVRPGVSREPDVLSHRPQLGAFLSEHDITLSAILGQRDFVSAKSGKPSWDRACNWLFVVLLKGNVTASRDRAPVHSLKCGWQQPLYSPAQASQCLAFFLSETLEGRLIRKVMTSREMRLYSGHWEISSVSTLFLLDVPMKEIRMCKKKNW